MELTDRQLREIAYHREHARQHERLLLEPFSYDSLRGTRWWNAHWEMYRLLRNDVVGKRVLIVGCGFGDDALRLAKAGGKVYGFDLSPETLAIARKLAAREGLNIEFSEQPAESLSYADATFDVVVARDILHHVDIPRTMSELRRVSKPGARWIINEIYSHTWTERVRRSRLVERALYPAMRRFVYQSDAPYITEDERKLTEADLKAVMAPLVIESRRYYNAIVTRLLPDKYTLAAKADRLLLAATGLGKWLGGRVLVSGQLRR